MFVSKRQTGLLSVRDLSRFGRRESRESAKKEKGAKEEREIRITSGVCDLIFITIKASKHLET